jgi:hypothetical protein
MLDMGSGCFGIFLGLMGRGEFSSIVCGRKDKARYGVKGVNANRDQTNGLCFLYGRMGYKRRVWYEYA